MRSAGDEPPDHSDGRRGALLQGVLALRVFTVHELAAYAGADGDVVLSFLADCGKWMEAPPSEPSLGQWRVRPAFLTFVHQAASAIPPSDARNDKVTTVSPGSQRPVDISPCVDVDSDVEGWFELAQRIIVDAEDDLRAANGDGVAAQTKPAQEDDVRSGAKRSPRLGAASMYLARCESLVWVRQHRYRVHQERWVVELRALRARLQILSAADASSSLESSSSLQETVQDWSEPISEAFARAAVRIPAVLDTLSEDDVAHWIAGDLGLSSPWYAAASRAASLDAVANQRWPKTRARLIAHCSEVLRLPSSAMAFASIGALAAVTQADELSLPLLAGLLATEPLSGSMQSSACAISMEDRRIVYMALSRLAQMPVTAPRLHSDAALACELLASISTSEAHYELVGPGALLRNMVEGLPWLDRALTPTGPVSATFDRNLVKAIFLAARNPKARSILSITLATPDGLELVARFSDGGVARCIDNAVSHLLIPSSAITASLMLSMLPQERDLQVLEMPLPVAEDSEASIAMCVDRSLEGWRQARGGGQLGTFSEGLKRKQAAGLGGIGE